MPLSHASTTACKLAELHVIISDFSTGMDLSNFTEKILEIQVYQAHISILILIRLDPICGRGLGKRSLYRKKKTKRKRRK